MAQNTLERQWLWRSHGVHLMLGREGDGEPRAAAPDLDTDTPERQFGAAVMLVEHNIDVVAASCDYVIALHLARL